MLRMIGFGDNAGLGFPTILAVWEKEGWLKPELIGDTNLNQVTLFMKMAYINLQPTNRRQKQTYSKDKGKFLMLWIQYRTDGRENRTKKLKNNRTSGGDGEIEGTDRCWGSEE